ncbi:glucosaminidase domain-containing protein [Thalassotalea euphylliae]|uniref:glucosaminidase domain-containing protein n=1 Tax=Thalassotalea euphylliae TaxID=1655234 RepID=UPI00362AF927
MKLHLKHIALTFIALCLFACSPSKDEEQVKQTLKPTQIVHIKSLDDLTDLFDKYQYNSEAWTQGSRAVPRLTFDGVTERWQKGSKNLPVDEKKQVFFRLMAPLILMSNEEILAERELAKNAPLSSEPLKQLAIKYKVIEKGSQSAGLGADERSQLLNRIDIVPPSLALAQAAEESGWATSRFTVEGNAFFGQWDFSGQGMIPKQQRKELGNYGLARFDTPFDSVKGYMFNINTGHAYQKLRDKRAGLRQQHQAITGLGLVETLDKYSERGQAYIDGISELITYNNLEPVDEAYLVGDHIIQLVADSE